MTGTWIDPDLLLSSVAVLAVLTLGVGTLWWRAHKRYQRLRARSAPDVKAQDAALGLVSGAAFDAALEVAASRCDRKGGGLCALAVELDGLSAVTGSHGRGAGDAVLSAFTARLHQATPGRLAAMRVGAEQIVVLLKGELPAAVELAGRLDQALSLPYKAPGHDALDLSASIGIACYPVHGARSALVGLANAALRTAQEGGGATHAVFDPKMAEDMRTRARMLGDLRAALRLRQLELYYQPKIDSRSLQVTAAEALIRWRHPTLGMISPGVFIPIAERHGLISAIGNWVIDEACRQAGVWRKAGLRMRVAINLSAYQMRQDDLVDRLQSALQANHLQPGRFTVEITESLAMESTQVTQRTFERLRLAGLHVAIDDFGAGQTSLAYLRTLPASELKLDISLVRDLEASADARTIAEALIKLAHALQRRVVAEGVETVAQRDILVAMGCDELQGFLFARPMSARAFSMWALDDRRPAQPGQFRPSLFTETIQR